MNTTNQNSEHPEFQFICALCKLPGRSTRAPIRGALTFCHSCSTNYRERCFAMANEDARPRSTLLWTAIIAICVLSGISVCWYAAIRARPVLRAQAANAGTNSGGNAPNSLGKSLWPFPVEELPPEPNTPPIQSVRLLFVTMPGTSMCTGFASSVYAAREPRNKQKAGFVTDIGDNMEVSFKEAMYYVEKTRGDWSRRFYIRLSFENKFSQKDGGSAGTAFAVIMIATTQGVVLDPEVAMTGDLATDGSVQPVGGVVEKVRGSVAAKSRLTLVPKRNARDVEDLVLLDGTEQLWDSQILSISTVDEALGLSRMDREPKVAEALEIFQKLRARLPAKVTANYLQSPIVKTELDRVLKLAPNHLSASILSRAAAGTLPKELSLNRSAEEILNSSALFISPVLFADDGDAPSRGSGSGSGSSNGGITIFPTKEFDDCVKRLSDITPILDKRTIELKAACISYGGALKSMMNLKTNTAQSGMRRQDYERLASSAQSLKTRYDSARSQLMLAFRKVSMDPSFIAETVRK